MSEKLERLREKRDKADRERRKASNDEKVLAKKMARLTKAERTHRLCTRAGMLETFLREPTLLADDDVMELLRFIFQSSNVQKKLDAMIESRKKSWETEVI